jgi:hypothetical protein
MTQSGTQLAGGGGGAGKANFSDLAARTRSGAGTVTLLDTLFGSCSKLSPPRNSRCSR